MTVEKVFSFVLQINKSGQNILVYALNVLMQTSIKFCSIKIHMIVLFLDLKKCKYRIFYR